MQSTLLNVATVKEESFNQITFFYGCLSNLLDRFTLATKSSFFLVAFYFYNKGGYYDELFSHYNVNDFTIITHLHIEYSVHLIS